MAKSALNVFAASSLYAVWTAPLGTTLPTTVTANPGAGWYEVGLLSDDGITETRDVNDNLIYDLLGSLVRNVRNQEQRSFGFTALEDNRVVRELKYVGSQLTSSGGTAEVQTVTLTGTGTAGTWTLTLPGYGTASGLSFNITTTALASALNSAFSMSGITVSGTAGSSYIVTFPTSAGNVPQMTATNAITGVTAIGVATTTPGVNGANSRAVGSGTGLNNRCWYIVAQDGAKGQAVALGNGEASATGDTAISGGAVKTSQFTVRAYPDTSGVFFYILDNDAAQAGSYA